MNNQSYIYPQCAFPENLDFVFNGVLNQYFGDSKIDAYTFVEIIKGYNLEKIVDVAFSLPQYTFGAIDENHVAFVYANSSNLILDVYTISTSSGATKLSSTTVTTNYTNSGYTERDISHIGPFKMCCCGNNTIDIVYGWSGDKSSGDITGFGSDIYVARYRLINNVVTQIYNTSMVETYFYWVFSSGGTVIIIYNSWGYSIVDIQPIGNGNSIVHYRYDGKHLQGNMAGETFDDDGRWTHHFRNLASDDSRSNTTSFSSASYYNIKEEQGFFKAYWSDHNVLLKSAPISGNKLAVVTYDDEQGGSETLSPIQGGLYLNIVTINDNNTLSMSSKYLFGPFVAAPSENGTERPYVPDTTAKVSISAERIAQNNYRIVIYAKDTVSGKNFATSFTTNPFIYEFDSPAEDDEYINYTFLNDFNDNFSLGLIPDTGNIEIYKMHYNVSPFSIDTRFLGSMPGTKVNGARVIKNSTMDSIVIEADTYTNTFISSGELVTKSRNKIDGITAEECLPELSGSVWVLNT